MKVNVVVSLALGCAFAASPLLGACSPLLPPQELKDARVSFVKAKAEATKDAPLELDEAKRALLAAERRFEEVGADAEVAGLGFVADRKAQRASALARKARLDRELVELQAAVKSRHDDRDAREKADAEKKRLDAERKDRELAEAKRLQKEAEDREAAALAALKKLASVRTEPRGLVITFAGAVLFATNGASLAPQAKTRLDELVSVLQRESPNAKILVEGHTDNQGLHSHNATLSKQRADAVADYLVKKGVAKDRVRTEGIGEVRPLATNSTNEGRATNRRVEVVVEK